MNKKDKHTAKVGTHLLDEHKEILDNASNDSVIINIEWNETGDYFRKFSMYDESYLPVKTLGNNTTLINEI